MNEVIINKYIQNGWKVRLISINKMPIAIRERDAQLNASV